MSKGFLWFEGLNECHRHWRRILHTIIQLCWSARLNQTSRCEVLFNKNKNASHHSVWLCIDNLTNSREKHRMEDFKNNSWTCVMLMMWLTKVKTANQWLFLIHLYPHCGCLMSILWETLTACGVLMKFECIQQILLTIYCRMSQLRELNSISF